jgi:hypothetical protein
MDSSMSAAFTQDDSNVSYRANRDNLSHVGAKSFLKRQKTTLAWTSGGTGNHQIKKIQFPQRKDFVCDPQNAGFSENACPTSKKIFPNWNT